MVERMRIERLGAAGDGVGRVAGEEVFAPFTVPGELVEGEIAGGRMPRPRILEPAPDRARAPCPQFGQCGGCATMHIREGWLAEWKRARVAEALARVGLAPELPPVLTSPPGSRRRAVLAGRRTRKGVIVGFHGRASETIVPLAGCRVLRPEILAAVPAFEALTALGASRRGTLKIAVTASEAGLDVDVSGARPLAGDDLVQAVQIAERWDLARLSWEREPLAERRPPFVRFGSARVVPPPGAFLQATEEGEAALVAEVIAGVGAARRVVDLFAGSGTFTLPVAACAEVLAVEGEGEMLAALERGWRQTPGLRPVRVARRDLFRNPLDARELSAFEAAVMDPPRAGARAQVGEIAASPLARVVHVSCNPATFARDAATLAAAGFSLDRVQVVDQFLWTGHIELVGLFAR